MSIRIGGKLKKKDSLEWDWWYWSYRTKNKIGKMMETPLFRLAVM